MMRELPTPDFLERLDHEWPVDPRADSLVDEIMSSHGLRAVSSVLSGADAGASSRPADAAIPAAFWIASPGLRSSAAKPRPRADAAPRLCASRRPAW